MTALSRCAWLVGLFPVWACHSSAPQPPAPAPAPVMETVQASGIKLDKTPKEVLDVPLRLVDVAKAAGVDHSLPLPGPPPYTTIWSVGHGAAFLDFDQDGWMDILLSGPRPQLFINNHDGHFKRLAANLDRLPEGKYGGLAVGDYDRDGYPDVFVSAYRGGVLLHNDGGKRFHDATKEAGITTQFGWTTATTFADLDRDGYLDLIVGQYLKYDPKHPLMCQKDGTSFECGPFSFPPEKPHVYKNVAGRFTDVTKEWGFDTSAGKNLGVIATDLDGDGQVEVIFANDIAPGDLFAKKGERFENVGALSGTAYSRMGVLRGGMGVDVGDYDRDGALDIVEMGFQYQGANLFRNIGPGQYKDTSFDNALRAATLHVVSFGARFADVDNNGWPDLLIANGHVYGQVEKLYAGMVFKEPMTMLYNQNGRLWEVSERIDRRPIIGRGLATADYDHDGRIDFLVVDDSGDVLLLHNETQPVGHYLSLRLLDKFGVDAYGATLSTQVGGRRYVEACHADGSYISSSDPRIHLGLGSSTSVPAVRIQWTSGGLEEFGPFPADQRIEVREGTGRPVPKGSK